MAYSIRDFRLHLYQPTHQSQPKHNTKQRSKNQTELERVKLDSVKRYVKEEKLQKWNQVYWWEVIMKEKIFIQMV